MTKWTDIYPGDPVLYARIWKKDPGQYTVIIPTPAGWNGSAPIVYRALARGCGGQGDHWGGGGAFARRNGTGLPGDVLLVQVGDVATANTPGDSWVKRSDGSIVCYADRGRGIGRGGMSSNCIGDVVGSGSSGGGTVAQGGASASDGLLFSALDAGSAGYDNTGAGFKQAADFGGGGHGYSGFNQAGVWMEFAAFGAGSGVVVIEFFLADPLY